MDQLAAGQKARKKVMLVDDHPILRGGLALVINAQPDIMVCCEADSASEAMAHLETRQPDLVVVDLSLEGKSGLELIKDLQTYHPHLPILVMSMHDETIYAERVLRAGARGYVMKRAGGETVLQAIRQVLRGEVYLSEKMASRLLGNLAGPHPTRKLSSIEMLTDREFEVYKLIGEGCNTRTVAGRLHISTKTVDVYRQHLRAKFHLPDSVSLIQHAVRWVESQDLDEVSTD